MEPRLISIYYSRYNVNDSTNGKQVICVVLIGCCAFDHSVSKNRATLHASLCWKCRSGSIVIPAHSLCVTLKLLSWNHESLSSILCLCMSVPLCLFPRTYPIRTDSQSSSPSPPQTSPPRALSEPRLLAGIHTNAASRGVVHDLIKIHLNTLRSSHRRRSCDARDKIKTNTVDKDVILTFKV